jgi:hypothetical protein
VKLDSGLASLIATGSEDLQELKIESPEITKNRRVFCEIFFGFVIIYLIFDEETQNPGSPSEESMA